MLKNIKISFRLKTIIGIALIEFVLLMTLIISGLNFLSESNEFQFQQRAHATLKLFASATKDAILSNDLAVLASAVDEMQHNNEVVYTRISRDGIVLAEKGDKHFLTSPRVVDTSYRSVDDHVFDIKTNIDVEGEIFGTIELGFSTTFIDEILVTSKKVAFSLAAIEIILVAFFSFVLGTYLTRQLNLLKNAAIQINKNGPGHQVSMSSHDEIADVAKSFNLMSKNLQLRYDDLKVSLNAHKKMAKDAHYNEAKITAILESSLDANITINSNDEIIEFNPIAETIFGWSQSEIIGQKLNTTIIPKAMRNAHNQGMAHFLKTGDGPVLGKRVELEGLHKNGHTFPIEISISPILSDKETLFTAFVRDLTQQKDNEKKHTIARQQAEQANDAKSRFLATMSHEIRSPLNAIITMNALLFDTNLNKNQLKMVQTVNMGGDILLSLINDILDFSKIESGKLNLNNDWFDLTKMVRDTITLLSSPIDKDKIKIRCHLSPLLKNSYFGDKQRIGQILINVFSNAIKFTQAGYVQVDLELNEKQHVVLKITDSGIGISEENQHSIFKEFQQVEDSNKRRFGGTGLGLSIVYRLIDKMHGSITVLSQLNQGSCFTITLPLSGSDALVEEKMLEVPKISNTNFRHKNILFVEDSPTNQVVIQALLEKLNLYVTCADNGKIAVKLTLKKQYDLILMDLAMPEMNGLEATRLIRTSGNFNANTPIIAISANAFDEDKEQCLAAGMDDFISKPINIDEFHAKFPLWMKARKNLTLERSVIKQLKKDTRAESLPKILGIFIQETKKREQAMFNFYKAHNLVSLADEAHTLKSSSATFGAISLQQLAQNIEHNAQQNNLLIIDSLMKELAETINDTLQSIQQIIKA